MTVSLRSVSPSIFYDWCVEKWPETTAVRVKETPKTCAEYRPLTYTPVDGGTNEHWTNSGQ
jgi:hypothetical protein